MPTSPRDKAESLKWRVDKAQAGMSLLRFLQKHYPQAPSIKAIKRAIDGKFCSVNGRIETFSSFALKAGDRVLLREAAFQKKQGPTQPALLYEDEALCILAKPPFVVCDPKSIGAICPGMHLVHRLDKETSGVLILAKTLAVQKKMLALFKERLIAKLYIAIVDGVLEADEGTIDNFLHKKLSLQGQAIYAENHKKQGQRAITYWKCLKRGKSASVARCEPYTGRTHQLRVHLSGIGHPILGDIQYGKKFLCPVVPNRNCLHAYCVSFNHPTTGQPLKVIAPIPHDLKQVLDELNLRM